MAGQLAIPIGACDYPDSNAAAVSTVKGSGSPAGYTPCHSYDAATDESVLVTIPYWPSGSSFVFKTKYAMASATSGSIRMEVLARALTPGDNSNVFNRAFDSTNNNGMTVPGTAGNMEELSVTLTNIDGAAAGDIVQFLVRRDADGTTGTDSATGDMQAVGYTLTWS